MILSFFTTELKNSIKMVAKTISAYILILTLLTAVISAVSFSIGRKEIVKKINTVIVLEDDFELSRVLLRYISGMDSVSAVSEFVYKDREEAFDMLNSGEANVVIILPKGFYEDIDSGYNTPLNIYIKEDADNITKAFVKVIKSGIDYVRSAEACVYAFIDVNRTEQLLIDEASNSIGDRLASEYLNLIIKRSRLFENKIVSEYGDIDALGFYFCTAMLCLMIYTGILFGNLYRNNNKMIENVMLRYVSPFLITLSKELILTLHIFLSSCILYIIATIVQSVSDIYIFEPKLLDLPVIAMVSFCLACLFDLIYTITGYDYGAMTVIITVMLILMFVGGILIPSSRLGRITVLLGNIDLLKYLYNTLLYISVRKIMPLSLAVTFFSAVIMCIVGTICRKH